MTGLTISRRHHHLAQMVVLSSSRFATAGKPLENQRYLKRAPRALAAIIGTERHQTARSGTESPEKVLNYVLQVFAGAATHRRAPVRDGQSAPNECGVQPKEATMNDVRREKYQVMPALPAEDYEALKADIAAAASWSPSRWMNMATSSTATIGLRYVANLASTIIPSWSAPA
jgi:hypothetical protein